MQRNPRSAIAVSAKNVERRADGEINSVGAHPSDFFQVRQ
jgi:hypothetical protein